MIRIVVALVMLLALGARGAPPSAAAGRAAAQGAGHRQLGDRAHRRSRRERRRRRRRRRCSARPISARPAPCRSRASPRRCGRYDIDRARHRRADRGGGDAAVARASPRKDIDDRIARAFAGQYGFGDAQNLAVILDRDVRILHVEPTVTGDLVVARMNVEPRTGRFDIAFELPGSTLSRRAAAALHRHGDRDRRGRDADALARGPARSSRRPTSRSSAGPRPRSAATASPPTRRSALPPRSRCAAARRCAPTI